MMGSDAIKAIWKLLRARRLTLLLGVVALGFQAFLLLPIAWLVQDIFAVRIPASDTRAVLVAGLGILILYAASTGLSLIARRLILVPSSPVLPTFGCRFSTGCTTCRCPGMNSRTSADCTARWCRIVSGWSPPCRRLLWCRFRR